MGSGDKKLQDSWATDIAFLLGQDIPCLFTCANDYMDVPGEVKVLQEHNARFLMEPCSCPFGCMTVLVPEGPDSQYTTQGNSFVYAVKGRQEPVQKGKATKACTGDGCKAQQMPTAPAATTKQNHMSPSTPQTEVPEQRTAQAAGSIQAAEICQFIHAPSGNGSDIGSQTAVTNVTAATPPPRAGHVTSCSSEPTAGPMAVDLAGKLCDADQASKDIKKHVSNHQCVLELPRPTTIDDSLNRLFFFDISGLNISGQEAYLLQAWFFSL